MKLTKTFLSGILALALGSASCLGPDNAYRSVKNWNAELANEDWINEALYIGMHILPVYPLLLLGDIVVFNTIGYWSGENPINDPGDFVGFSRDD